VIYIDNKGNEIARMSPNAESGNVFLQQLCKYEINMQSVVLRNNINTKFNEKLRHSPDFELFMNIASEYKVYVISDYLVKYRKLENSLTSKNIDVWWIEMKGTLDKIFLEKNSLKIEYPKEFNLAYAKVAYNKARYLISIDKQKQASAELSRYKFTNVTYCLLFLISLFPRKLWDIVHRLK